MNNYLPSTERELCTYSIKDHKHLQEGKTLELFLTLRREVMMLDPCVTEEFLKLYVAFKAETNFVDVIPLANSLKFSINMRFSEISDPKGICKDTTHLGRWGNGDVEIHVKELDEIPYAIGLVRQALEKQLGDD